MGKNATTSQETVERVQKELRFLAVSTRLTTKGAIGEYNTLIDWFRTHPNGDEAHIQQESVSVRRSSGEKFAGVGCNTCDVVYPCYRALFYHWKHECKEAQVQA